jgi:hypothetical protein
VNLTDLNSRRVDDTRRGAQVPTYSINAKVTGSKWLGYYKAESEKAAIEAAMEELSEPVFCHQCCSECEDPEIDECSITATEITDE